MTSINLGEISHAAIDNRALDAERLHAHRHDAAQDGAVLAGGLLDHGDGAGLGPVDPVRADREAVGVGSLRHGVILCDEFGGPCGRDDFGCSGVSADGGGEGDWLCTVSM